MSSFSSELREHRRRHKLTQKALAELIGVVNQTVKNWERPRNLPNHEHMERLQGVFRSDHLLWLWSRKW